VNDNPAIRMSLIVLMAIIMNALMFGAIQYMVVNRQIRLSDTSNFDLANFIRMQEQSREVRSRRDPKAPQKPKADQQQDLSRLAEASRGSGLGGLSVNLPDIDFGIDTSGSIQIARELTPLVRFPPDYPQRALANGTEGYVTLRFTVTETGAVADPEVLRSEPPGVFDRAAMRAVLRFKYQPQMSDGQPVRVITYTRLRFQIVDPE
jgi:protein TonB